jgi:methanogenic corrinoid protein MtbC1
VVATALTHVAHLDAASLDCLLNDASVDMPRLTFVQSVVMPMFEAIGDGWRNGKIKIISEHMASVIVRSTLWDMLRSAQVSQQAPCIVVATPVGHRHEIGALAAALAASESGWRAAYFGPSLPSEEIVYAVKRLDARAIALSLSHRLADNRLVPELTKLRRLVGEQLPVFVGGSGSDVVRQLAQRLGLRVIYDLDALRKDLDDLALDVHG